LGYSTITFAIVYSRGMIGRISLAQVVAIHLPRVAGKFSFILIVSGLLALIGGGIWRRTQMAIAPPIHDPISYYCKAEFVWDAIAKGDLKGILNGPMAPRPPGTALILYPFGFRASVHSFLLRSVFAPILIWAIALSIPVVTQVRSLRDALLGSALIAGLISLPLFYHFELNDTFSKIYNVTNQWGLVDCLEGAIGALAISLLCFGIINGSKTCCALGWFVSAFSFFIKPSGLLIMIASIAITIVEFSVLIFENRSRRRTLLRLAFFVYSIGFCVFALALWLAFDSDYMNRAVIGKAIRASQFLLELNQGRKLFAMLALFVVPVVGWWWFCPGLLYAGSVIIEAFRSVAKRQWNAVALRLAAAGAILVSAISWWNLLAGQDPRYLFPFILMVIAWFTPEIFHRIRQFPFSAQGAVAAYCLASPLLLGGLLWSKQPPNIFQQLMGVNLSTGGYGSEVSQGQWLLTESERLGRPINLYSLGELGAGVIEMEDWVHSIENQNAPHKFVVKRPLNWVDSPGLRLDELLQSDFLLIENLQEISGQSSLVSSWREEVERFKQFAYSRCGIEANGLELVADGPVKLLRVGDRQRFAEALYHWVNCIRWKDDFPERNKLFLAGFPK
jgi:hypothetical protein